MLRYISLSAVSFALLLVLVAPVLADDVHQGKILVVGDAKIMIQDQNGDNEEFAVAADAKITLNGKPAKLGDLSVGDMAKVTVKKINDKNVAVTIEAKSKA